MYVCAYANYATWTTFLKRTEKDIMYVRIHNVSVCKYLYIVHRPTNIYNAKYIAPSAHMETCINYSQFRQVLVCNLSPITYLHTSYLLLSTYIPERSKPLCMYVRAGRRPPGESAAELTHPFPFARYISVPMPYVTTHTYICNLLVLSNLPSFLPQQNRKRKKKKCDLVSLTTWWCYSIWLTNGAMWLPCDKNICGEKMPIESLLHSSSSQLPNPTYCNYSYLLAAPAL